VYARFELPITFSSTKLDDSDFVSCRDAERNFKNIVYLLQKHCNEPRETGELWGKQVWGLLPLRKT